MNAEEGRRIYKPWARCQLVHARYRNLGLDHLWVRGRQKVEACARWFALATNILIAARLSAAATVA
jgi:hypothetical protein